MRQEKDEEMEEGIGMYARPEWRLNWVDERNWRVNQSKEPEKEEWTIGSDREMPLLWLFNPLYPLARQDKSPPSQVEVLTLTHFPPTSTHHAPTLKLPCRPYLTPSLHSCHPPRPPPLCNTVCTTPWSIAASFCHPTMAVILSPPHRSSQSGTLRSVGHFIWTLQ